MPEGRRLYPDNKKVAYALPSRVVTSNGDGEPIAYRDLKKFEKDLQKNLNSKESHDFAKQITRHINSKYAYKRDIFAGLKIIYEHYNSGISKPEKKSIALALNHEIHQCTQGFHERVNSIIGGFYSPKNVAELLYLYRQDITHQVAAKLTREIHSFNWVFTLANDQGYGVTPPNSNAEYIGDYRVNLEQLKTDSHNELKITFDKKMDLLSMVRGLEQQLLNEIAKNGYQGQSTKFDHGFTTKTEVLFDNLFDNTQCIIDLHAAQKEHDEASERNSKLYNTTLEEINQFIDQMISIHPELSEYFANQRESKVKSLLQELPERHPYSSVKFLTMLPDKEKQQFNEIRSKLNNVENKTNLQKTQKQLVEAQETYHKSFYCLSTTEEVEPTITDINWPNIRYLLWKSVQKNYFSSIDEELKTNLDNFFNPQLDMSIRKTAFLAMIGIEPFQLVDDLDNLFALCPEMKNTVSIVESTLFNELLSVVEKNNNPKLFTDKYRNSETMLLRVARHGLTELAKHLIQLGVDVNAQDSLGQTPLMRAVYNGHTDLVTLLLDQNATINPRANQGFNALDLAVSKNPRFVDTILMRIATLPLKEQADCLTKCANGTCQNALSYATKLKKPDLIEGILTHLATLPAEKQALCLPDAFPNILFYAAENNQDLFEKLINEIIKSDLKLYEVASIINATNTNGATPLMLAAKHGINSVSIQQLIDRGANIQAKDHLGNTALHYASTEGHTDIIHQLLQNEAVKQAINDPNNMGETVLMSASYYGRKDTVAMLIKNGANVNIQHVHTGNALTYAVNQACAKTDPLSPTEIETIKLLIDRGADITEAFHQAIKFGKAEIIEPFLIKLATLPAEKQAEFITKVPNGATPLMLAAKHGINSDSIKKLIDCGANIQAKDYLGNTALHYASTEGHTDIIHQLLQNEAVKQAINDPNNMGETVLMSAIYYGRKDTVAMLIKNGANVNIPHVHTGNALTFAVNQACAKTDPLSPTEIETIKLLIDSGADITEAFKSMCNENVDLTDSQFENQFQLLNLFVELLLAEVKQKFDFSKSSFFHQIESLNQRYNSLKTSKSNDQESIAIARLLISSGKQLLDLKSPDFGAFKKQYTQTINKTKSQLPNTNTAWRRFLPRFLSCIIDLNTSGVILAKLTTELEKLENITPKSTQPNL